MGIPAHRPLSARVSADRGRFRLRRSVRAPACRRSALRPSVHPRSPVERVRVAIRVPPHEIRLERRRSTCGLSLKPRFACACASPLRILPPPAHSGRGAGPARSECGAGPVGPRVRDARRRRRTRAAVRAADGGAALCGGEARRPGSLFRAARAAHLSEKPRNVTSSKYELLAQHF